MQPPAQHSTHLASTRGETFVALLVLELGFAHRTHRYLAVFAIGLPGSMAAQLAGGRLAGHDCEEVSGLVDEGVCSMHSHVHVVIGEWRLHIYAYV